MSSTPGIKERARDYKDKLDRIRTLMAAIGPEAGNLIFEEAKKSTRELIDGIIRNADRQQIAAEEREAIVLTLAILKDTSDSNHHMVIGAACRKANEMGITNGEQMQWVRFMAVHVHDLMVRMTLDHWSE